MNIFSRIIRSFMLISCSAAALLFICAAKGESSKQIVIATDPTYLPMEFKDGSGALTGFEIELMKAAAAEEGYSIRFVDVPWDGILAGLVAGKYDAVCSSVTIKDERKTTMDFSRPYINGGQMIVVRKSGWRPRSLKELKGRNCGAITGTTGEMLLEKNGAKMSKSYDTFMDVFDDLRSGVIEAVVIDLAVAARFTMHEKKFKGKLAVSAGPLNEDYFGVVVKKGNRDVLDVINAGLKKVMDKGIYKELCMKWFGMEVALP